MTRKNVAYFVIFVGLVLLVLNVIELDFGNPRKGPILGIVSNLLLVTAMVLSLREIDNAKNTKND